MWSFPELIGLLEDIVLKNVLGCVVFDELLISAFLFGEAFFMSDLADVSDVVRGESSKVLLVVEFVHLHLQDLSFVLHFVKLAFLCVCDHQDVSFDFSFDFELLRVLE